ncbi:uncharacterized protein BJ212DRAFT_1476352 [Suillus subaureus]|uniref:Uncharacterized protein n=1 Tax=Suillus subaureus TaxID=48587 RepID=A0A9P7JI37_9AGAM|nr:uncharacterized protein BJ212DRAFT_1476352 [Suillus subaureus]KAG1823471.1 hypothetical protein BJ212DRAFT_1476352 [Suillus subaureus]
MASSPNLVKELRPVTSTTTRRYGKLLWVDAYHTTTAPGLRLRTSTQSKWLSCIHPEGQLYFHMKCGHLSVVTEENVLNIETDNLVSSYLAVIEKRIVECGIILPQTCELFIELRFDEPPQTTTCAYYFVDHHSRCLFWLEPTSSELLDMGMLVSDSHLDTALERLYWVHVEFFPMHVCAQMTPLILDNLISVICHGMTDRMTSRTSTFPYTEEKCDQLLRALSLRRGEPLDGYTLCFVARLWGAINNQRFMTYYGQENAQLDRLHPPMPEDIVDHPGMRALANMMLWGIPNHHHSKLHDLMERVDCVGIFGPDVMPAVLISMLPRASMSSAIAPILAASSSILSGSILLLRHHGFEDATASFAATFLRAAKSSDWGFLPLSVIYSMPKAMYLWSIGLMVAQFIFWASRVVGVLWASCGAAFLALMGYGIFHFTSLEDGHSDPMATMLRSHWQTFQSGSAEAAETSAV